LDAHFIDYYGDSQGRPPKWPLREILKAIIWILHTGAQWHQLPKNFPPYQKVDLCQSITPRDDRLAD